MSTSAPIPDSVFMKAALSLARRGYGTTSPNPMVGALLVRAGKIVGQGWHHRAGQPHAEIEALRDAQRKGNVTRGATLFVTLEPCCTHGRTPPCTEAIVAAGIQKVVVGSIDPNPRHSGRAFKQLRNAGVQVVAGVLENDCRDLNEAFNHWIVRGTPFVTVKAAMTLDGKIATASGESKWITGEKARSLAMRLRFGSDAILVGVNTVLADDPSLTVRGPAGSKRTGLRRIVLDSLARTPLSARVVSDEHSALTTIVVTDRAPRRRVLGLLKHVHVLVAPGSDERRERGVDLRWLLARLGSESVTSLLVEGGGEVNAAFLMPRLAQRIAFFYAPKVIGGKDSRRAVAGQGAETLDNILELQDLLWRRLGPDWFLTARVGASASESHS